MSRLGISVIVLVFLVILVLIGAIAYHVGGVSLRTSRQMYKVGRMTVNNSALLPGAPIRIHIDLGTAAATGASSIVLLRTPEESVVIGKIMKKNVDSGEGQVTVPCAGIGKIRGKVRLILVDGKNQAVLAQSELLTVLPPGPDCLY